MCILWLSRYPLRPLDFIFGNAAAVFQMCTTVIAAESAEDQKDKFGFSILRSKLLAYTGRRVYYGCVFRSVLEEPPHMVVMETELGKLIDPKRWIAWNSSADSPPPTVNFNEYQNYELQLRLLHD
ncbi:unnamed protein product [Brassica rapa subsp. trilocularis]